MTTPANDWRGVLALLTGLAAGRQAVPAREAPLPEGRQEARQEAAPPLYDEAADARAVLAAAQARARAENRRVLVVWGANWCGWCKKLHGLFEKDAQVARKLLYEYDVVKIDVGHSDKNMDLVSELGADLAHGGLPYLSVLDGQGHVLANQETGSLEEDDHHDPARVLAFLGKHQAPYEEAATVRDRALAAAAAAGKPLLLHLGAPW